MRYVRDNRFGYWLVGTALIWLLLPASLFDVLAAGEWTAPNPQCDSFGIPIMDAITLALPWAVFAACLAAVVMFLLVRRRVAGADIFDAQLGAPPWKWLIAGVTLLLLGCMALDVGRYVWDAVTPQTIFSDCGGTAERVAVTLRGPILQVMPVLEILLGLWVLHIRALLLSPRWPGTRHDVRGQACEPHQAAGERARSGSELHKS